MAQNNFPTLNINTETVVLEKYFFGANARVSQIALQELAHVHRDQTLRMTRIYEELSPMYGDLLIGIRGYLLKSAHEEVKTITISAPATWWDHLKSDFLKSGVKWRVWLAGKFEPPQYVTNSREYKETVRVCPHNDTYFSESSNHISYLLWKDDKPWR